MTNNHLEVIDLSDNNRDGGLIKTSRRHKVSSTNNKPNIYIVPRKTGSKVSKWAKIPSFSNSNVYRVVKYRRQGTVQRYACQCIDFIMRKNPNEGKGHSRTCKHIRYFKQLEKEQNVNQSSTNGRDE